MLSQKGSTDITRACRIMYISNYQLSGLSSPSIYLECNDIIMLLEEANLNSIYEKVF